MSNEMELFHTREKANEGRKVPLYSPDGEPTNHWVKIRGVDSDPFREAETSAKRSAMELAQIEDDQERAEKVREKELAVIASLIADWSFDMECNETNVVKFLHEAPQIADMVNRYAAQRSLFFQKKSEPSVDG